MDIFQELRGRLIEREHALHSLQHELNQKLNEKDQMIMNLQRENKILAEEKFGLMSRLETARDRTDTDFEAMSLKVSVILFVFFMVFVISAMVKKNGSLELITKKVDSERFPDLKICIVQLK